MVVDFLVADTALTPIALVEVDSVNKKCDTQRVYEYGQMENRSVNCRLLLEYDTLYVYNQTQYRSKDLNGSASLELDNCDISSIRSGNKAVIFEFKNLRSGETRPCAAGEESARIDFGANANYWEKPDSDVHKKTRDEEEI